MPRVEIGVINRPMPGQEVSGDLWSVANLPGRGVIFVADGLGHGPAAAQASIEAVRTFGKHARDSACAILEAVHVALAGTRGVAAAVASIDLRNNEVTYAGVGNISGVVVTGAASHGMASNNGIVGHIMPVVQESRHPFPPGAVLILSSDGLASRWRLDKYPGLCVRRPGLIAGILYRDFQRKNDDTTVVVAAARDLIEDTA